MKTTWQKLACGVLAGCLTLALAVMVYAHKSPEGGPDPAEMERHLRAQLDGLVTSNTITQAQSDKIAGMFRQKAAERQAEHDKIQQMPPDDRDAYMQKSCLQRCSQQPPDFAGDLVSIAGLSSEQAKVVAEALRPPHRPAPPDGKKRPEAPGKPDPAKMEIQLKSQLGQLVEAQTISQNQSDKIIETFRQKDAERRAEHDKIREMSPEDRSAYLKDVCQQRCSQRPDPVKDLTEAANLSPEQAKAVAEALRPPHHPAPPDGKSCPPPVPAPGNSR